MLNNIKTKERGFTIVELLIVIVVIAILAAITIVAYNGIQNRAKSSSAQTLANNVSKKAEIYNTVNTGYPVTLTAFKAGTGEAAMDTATAAKVTLTVPANENTVQFQTCDSGAGVRIVWYDAQASGTKNVNSGSTTTCTTPAS